MYVLPLSHKSGALCLYEPLPVSDALGDVFFEIFDVFLVETFFFGVCMYVCIFIKLHITAQSGPVILVILCHSH